jgi:hypothetical protein
MALVFQQPTLQALTLHVIPHDAPRRPSLVLLGLRTLATSDRARMRLKMLSSASRTLSAGITLQMELVRMRSSPAIACPVILKCLLL